MSFIFSVLMFILQMALIALFLFAAMACYTIYMRLKSFGSAVHEDKITRLFDEIVKKIGEYIRK